MSNPEIRLCDSPVLVLKDAPRPTTEDANVIWVAAEKVAEEVYDWLEDDTRNTTMEELARVFSEMDLDEDGCTLARTMKRNGWAGVNADLVGILDNACSHLIWARDQAVSAWLLATGRTAQLSVGDAVRIPKRRTAIRSSETGQLAGRIASIGSKWGTYTVCIPELGHTGCTDGSVLGTIGSIFNWEEVEGWNPRSAL